MDAEQRSLLARATKAEEDAALCRERLAAAYQGIAAVRDLVPAKLRQVNFKGETTASDPLVRLFLAIALKPGGG